MKQQTPNPKKLNLKLANFEILKLKNKNLGSELFWNTKKFKQNLFS